MKKRGIFECKQIYALALLHDIPINTHTIGANLWLHRGERMVTLRIDPDWKGSLKGRGALKQFFRRVVSHLGKGKVSSLKLTIRT